MRTKIKTAEKIKEAATESAKTLPNLSEYELGIFQLGYMRGYNSLALEAIINEQQEKIANETLT